MKTFKVNREIQKFNKNAKSSIEFYSTTEKGTLKEFKTLEDAKRYLADLRRRAFQTRKFESVTNIGVRQFRAHHGELIYIFKIV